MFITTYIQTEKLEKIEQQLLDSFQAAVYGSMVGYQSPAKARTYVEEEARNALKQATLYLGYLSKKPKLDKWDLVKYIVDRCYKTSTLCKKDTIQATLFLLQYIMPVSEWYFDFSTSLNRAYSDTLDIAINQMIGSAFKTEVWDCVGEVILPHKCRVFGTLPKQDLILGWLSEKGTQELGNLSHIAFCLQIGIEGDHLANKVDYLSKIEIARCIKYLNELRGLVC